jgi:cellulose synthase/poly-beta-1,6-N-acetylglucosamine synthase-like glycosyltransferase
MIAGVVIILLFYVVLILGLAYGFTRSRICKPSGTGQPATRFSVVIPFRNEAENIPGLLESLSALEYPRDMFEVILVDDESDDHYEIPAHNLNLRVLPNLRRSTSPKKDALKTAISVARYDWIVSTDADCRVGTKWLTTLDSFIKSKSVVMVAGAVRFDQEDHFLNHFQQLDLLSLQGATIGSFGLGRPLMCNAANFAYTKSLFQDLNGFEGNQNHPGGDDVFLLHKAIKTMSGKIGYLMSPDFIVGTRAEHNWKDLFLQRVRWASKGSAYRDHFAKICALIVLLGNIATITAAIMLMFEWTPLLFGILMLRVLADFLLIGQAATFLQRKTHWYIPVAIIYPLFSTVAGVWSLWGKFEWKGRKF